MAVIQYFQDQIKKNKCLSLISNNIYIIILIFFNFITNFLFILQYKFFSDDWELIVAENYTHFSYFHYLMNPQRPLFDIIYKFQRELFYDNYLIYHILGFITTTIFLILVYLIAKKILSDFNYTSEIVPFVITLFYCVLVNKDECYPFALLAFGFPYIMYLISFYTYINKERKYYLVYSLIAYTLAIFTYESGMILPVIFFAYDVLLKKDFKKSFLFAIPLSINLIVRKTAWFGFGLNYMGHGLGQWEIQNLLMNTSDFFIATFFITIRQILYAFYGLQSMGYFVILIIIINSITLLVLSKLLDFKVLPRLDQLSFGLLIVIITAAFAAPYILRGGLLSGSLPTRSFLFIDIGIAFILVLLLTCIQRPHVQKYVILLFVGTNLFLCQGLMMNWAISGNMQDDIYQYIGKNTDEISKYEYIYFNTTSFIAIQPNTIDKSVFTPFARIYYTYIRKDPRGMEQYLINLQQQSDLYSNNEYDRYYNAKALDNYALASMLAAKMVKFNDKNYTEYLIYGKNLNVPVEFTEE